MSNDTNSGKHVDELLSGFIDGELTQQEAQHVRLHCENCEDCRRGLDELRALREKLGHSNLSNVQQDVWRETMDDTAVKATRGIGWVLFLGGALLMVGFLLVTVVPELTLMQGLIVGGFYGGLLFLFVSVLRQRLIERKSDKYKDVEI